MDDTKKVTTYELFIEDMLHDFQGRFDELSKDLKSLTDYEKGRWSAYREIIDIIKTREDQISEMLTSD